jgi:hypothetical protein
MSNLIGQYQIDKSNLIGTNIQLVIGTRKTVSATKSKNYLLQKVSASQFNYISSMYAVRSLEGEQYTFDHSGIGYKLTIDRSKNVAIINQLHEGGAGVQKT